MYGWPRPSIQIRRTSLIFLYFRKWHQRRSQRSLTWTSATSVRWVNTSRPSRKPGSRCQKRRNRYTCTHSHSPSPGNTINSSLNVLSYFYTLCQKIKEENERLLQEYGFCIMDNHKERIGNFRIEPPGLFRGRGDHPKMGMLKRRIRPEDIIINCSKWVT